MLFSLVFLISLVKSQSCSGSDLLVDDFTVSRLNKATALGAAWNGDETTSFNVDVSKKSIVVQSNSSSNWFTTDFNAEACNDFTTYYGVSFDMIGPSDVLGSFTFTQKSPDCSVRIESGDSVALPITNYYKTPGVKSSVVLPFEDFSKTSSGSAFDFVHLKGWVMIQFNANSVFEFSNFKVLKCKPSITTTTGSVNTPASTPAVNSRNDNSSAKTITEGILIMTGFLLSFAIF